MKNDIKLHSLHIKHPGKFTPEQFPYKSLRGFLGDMEERGELAHIRDEIDWKYEIGTIAKKVVQSFDKVPGVYFHNIKDYAEWTAVTNVVNTYDRLFRVLGSSKPNVFDDFAKKTEGVSRDTLRNFYTVAERGDFEDIELTGTEIDITKLPIPHWSEFDGGRYITAGLCMCTDPETGIQNMSVVRLMVQGPRQTGILITYLQDIGKNYLTHSKMKKSMPLAVAIGTDPLMHLCSQLNAPRDVSEFAYWGALTGGKAEMVKCKTNDLLVPKNSEIILEGEVPIGELHPEGPFGEFTGFYSGVRDLNVFKINKLSMKEDAIYQGMGVGKDPNEGNFLTSWGSDLSVMKFARSHFSEITGVRSITANGLTTVVAIDHNRIYPGLAKAAGHLVWACPQLAKEAKNIIVVDDTIDIYSDHDIFWALCNYVQGNKDVSVVEGAPGVLLDPSEPWGMGYVEKEKVLLTKAVMVIDATPKWGIFSEPYQRGVVDFPQNIKQKVTEKWSQWGMDKFY